jgi:PAS domain S-box-containing protein
MIFAAGATLVAFAGGLAALIGHDAANVAWTVFLAGVVLVAFGAGLSGRPPPDRREETITASVLRHAVHSIVTTSVDGTVETFSPGAERLLGIAAADVIHRQRFTDFLDATELAKPSAGVAPVDLFFGAANRDVSERDWTLVGRDGRRVPARLSVTAMHDPAGEITGYLCIITDMTAHRLAEERRREFDARLSKIASQIPGMVFQFKQFPDGRRCFPYASEGMREVLRIEPAAVAENSAILWESIHPEDVEKLGGSIHESALTLQRWQCEFRIRFADGTVRWLWGTALPERQPDGALLWHGFLTDITERKHAEQAHEESRVLLQSIFSSVDLGVFVVDVTSGGDFRFVEVNPAYERLTGIHAVDIRGRSPQELVPLIPVEMAECLRTSFRRGAESPSAIEYEEPFFVKGRLLWWLTRLAPLRDAAGNVVRLVGRSLDITDRKNIELRFHSLTERLQLATEAAQVGIWDFDVSQNRLVWDKRMHALYGTSAMMFDNSYQSWCERLHPDDRVRVEQEHRDAIEGRKNLNTSFRIIRTDGELREIRACAHVQRNPAGRAQRVVGVNWDVTAERRAHAEIEHARDRAEKLNGQLEQALDQAHRLAQEAAAATTAKSEFLANMSHEIRTPLNAVIGMSGLLLGTQLSREQQEFAEMIRSSGDGLLGLINDILDYSKIESGRLELERRPFDLRECVEAAVDVLTARAAEKRIDLLCSIDASVPAAVDGDDTRLRQVLVNLLSNAVKFTSHGEVLLSVTVATTPAAQGVRLRFAVHDSGIGIPAARMDRLFKTFSQVDASTTRQYGGTGLGLAISKRIVEIMGGRIWVESTERKGSSFYFEIDAPVVLAEQKPHATGRLAALTGRRVLVVDDNAASCRVLCQQMIGWGVAPRAVASGAEALVVLEQGETYDLVVSDVEMPEMDGPELAKRIRERRSPKELPIAWISWPGRTPVAGDLGIVAAINKPVKPAALFELLIEVFQGRRDHPTSVAAAQTQLGELHPLVILLAEDNPVNQRVAKLMLQRIGYRVDAVNNGREAVEAITRRTYDLILMDVQMPEMDGLQATREICARLPANQRPRIVAMTANASTSDRDQCLDAGMNDFLTKPVRADELLRALKETPTRAVASAA